MTNELRLQFVQGEEVTPKEIAALCKQATDEIAKGVRGGAFKTAKGKKVGYWTWTPRKEGGE